MTAEELRALADQATPGPWRVGTWDDDLCVHTTTGTVCFIREGQDADADLIALAKEMALLLSDMTDHVAATGAYLASMRDPSPAVAQAEDLAARFAGLGAPQQEDNHA